MHGELIAEGLAHPPGDALEDQFLGVVLKLLQVDPLLSVGRLNPLQV
jgi:hypothetical protein